MGWKTSFPSFKHPLRYMNTVGWDSLSVFVASVQSCNLLTSSLIRVKTLTKARLFWLGLLLTWRHPATTSVSRCSQKKKKHLSQESRSRQPIESNSLRMGPTLSAWCLRIFQFRQAYGVLCYFICSWWQNGYSRPFIWFQSNPWASSSFQCVRPTHGRLCFSAFHTVKGGMHRPICMHGPDRSERIWVFGPFQVFHQWPRPKMLRLLSVISSASFIIIAAANSENRTFLKKRRRWKSYFCLKE
jgi:hypothetical protein